MQYMGRTRDCHIRRSKSDTEQQMSYDIAHIWNLKKDYYLQNRQTVAVIENKLMLTRVKGWGGINWKFETDTYALIHTQPRDIKL